MPESEPQLAFITDDEISRQLQQIENALRHLEATIPSLARQLATIRKALKATAT